MTTIYKDRRVETKAATDELAWKPDSLQYELGEGPAKARTQNDPVQDAVRRVGRRQRTASDQ